MKAPCRRSGHEDKQRRQWKPTKETLDLEALIAADGRAPRFEESVDLWRDDLDPHSFGFFRVRVRAHERFWVAYSRFFIRVRVPRLLPLLDGASMASTQVNGVRARVIDARFAGFGDRVLRERSWREGDWTAVAGAGAPPCVDLGGLLRRPAILCVLVLGVDVALSVGARRRPKPRRAAAGPGARPADRRRRHGTSRTHKTGRREDQKKRTQARATATARARCPS